MARFILPPGGIATGIGALPHTDPAAGCDAVRRIFYEFPYIPTFPRRGICETIVFNDSSRLPGRIIREGKLLVDSGRDLSSEMEQIYLDYVECNTAPYGLNPRYATGFFGMMKEPLPEARWLKYQVTGPVTFGMQVVDAGKRPIYYDEQFADVLPKMLGLRAKWCETEMKARTGIEETVIVLNEPYFSSLGSSVIPIDRGSVESGWHDIATLLEGGLGVHCCANTDWEFVMSLLPSVLSFDAYQNARELLLYKDALCEFLEAGGIVAWGIVPADYQVFSKETPESLYLRYMEIRSSATEIVSEDLFDSNSLITPSCGIQFADEAGSVAIMEAARAVSDRVRGNSG
ncbi:MAG: hypothetical protein LUO88_04295 [Methanoregulaceae archaeon]|nr:hypothetical protein [Methanoregulaceae archaeon]